MYIIFYIVYNTYRIQSLQEIRARYIIRIVHSFLGEKP